MVYDVTDDKSFKNVRNWLTECDRFTSEFVNKLLIGNKCDLDPQRRVQYHDGKAFAEQNKMEFIETSAKTNAGVTEGFTLISDRIIKRLDSNGSSQGGGGGSAGGVDIKKGRKSDEDGKGCAC